MKLSFDRGMRHMRHAEVSVVDFDFGKVTTDETKRAVEVLLRPWLSPGVAYKRMWSALGGADAAHA